MNRPTDRPEDETPSSARWEQLETWFDRLRDEEPLEQRRLLRAAAIDPDTRVELESLLDAHREDAIRLEAPAFERADLTDLPTRRPLMGPYRLLRVLGSGGMGLVFEAEQDHPKRRVALKLQHGGPWVDELQRRLFRREADVLARLEHPHIARILDAGTTDAGESWFTMELVSGAPLDLWVADEGVTLTAIVRLFHRLADAVGFAHQQGVIHCDLKPGNILVSGPRNNPDFKILDFGLARFVPRPGAPEATLSGTLRGSLAWMSPEQARGEITSLGPPTDVYSLGVMLYRALAGRAPYEVDGKPLHEAVRLISEVRPFPVQRSVPKDLALIIGKAMEKEASRRFPTAAHLSADLLRWLNREPVTARAPGRGYRTLRFVQRNLVGTVVGVVLIASLASFAIVASLQAADLAQQRDEAERQRALNARLLDWWDTRVLAPADPLRSTRPNITVAELLRAHSPSIDLDFADEPLLAADLHHLFARTWIGLGQPARAAQHLERTLQLRTEHLGADAERTLSAQNDLSQPYLVLGRQREALALLQNVVARRRQRFGTADHPLLLTALNNLGRATAERGDLDEAERLLREALSRRQRSLGPNHLDTLTTESNLAGVLLNREQVDAAEALLAHVLTKRQQQLEAHHPLVVLSVVNLAKLRTRQGRFDEARSQLEQIRPLAERSLGPDHEKTLAVLEATVLVLRDSGDLAAARDLQIDLLERCRQHLGPNSPVTQESQFQLARIEHLLGNTSGARTLLVQLLERQKRLLAPGASELIETYNSLAILHAQSGDFARAERILDDGIEHIASGCGPQHAHVMFLESNRGSLLVQMGETERGLRVLEAVLPRIRDADGPDHERTLLAELDLAHALRRTGRFADALVHAQRVHEVLRQRRGRHRHTLAATSAVAQALMALDRPEDALPHFEQLVSDMALTMPAEEVHRAEALVEYGKCLERLDKRDAAKTAYQQAAQLLLAANSRRPKDLLLAVAAGLERGGATTEAPDDDAFIPRLRRLMDEP